MIEGIEDELDRQETEEHAEPLDLDPGERRLVTQPYDFSVRNLVDDISADKLLLKLEFQRAYVWDETKASRLIESLLMNVPIPVCYFAEETDGTFEVIDGQQRLKSIWKFIANDADDERLVLRGLTVLKELNGKTFSELSQRDQRRVETRTIRCIVITEDSHQDIKFDVFERLNTGSVRLSDQELRNCIYRGAFNDLLRETARDESFRRILQGQLTKRMDDAELVLRFVALSDRLQAYKPALRQFLNEYMRDHRGGGGRVDELTDAFRRVAETAEAVFGNDAFRRIDREDAAGRTINKALFDCVALSFYLADQDAIREQKDQVRTQLLELLRDEEFEGLIGRATADRSRMFGRVRAFSERLESLGIGTSYAGALPADQDQ